MLSFVLQNLRICNRYFKKLTLKLSYYRLYFLDLEDNFSKFKRKTESILLFTCFLNLGGDLNVGKIYVLRHI